MEMPNKIIDSLKLTFSNSNAGAWPVDRDIFSFGDMKAGTRATNVNVKTKR